MAVATGQLIPEKLPGSTITAEEWNTLVREVNALRNIRSIGGDGATGSRVTRSGNSIVLVNGPARKAHVIPARITAAPAYAPTWPGDCKYSAVAEGEPSIIIEDTLPSFHRLVRDDDGPDGKGECGVWPAKVGDRCYIHWLVNDDGDVEGALECPTERLYAVPCGTSAAVGGATGPGETEVGVDPPSVDGVVSGAGEPIGRA